MLVSDAVLGFESCLPVIICSKNDDVRGNLGGVDGEVLVGDAAGGAPSGVKIKDTLFISGGSISGRRIVKVTGRLDLC